MTDRSGADTTEHHVVVTDRLRSAIERPALGEVVAGDVNLRRLLASALVTIEDQATRLADSEAENREFRAEFDETNRGLLALYGELQTANQRIADLVAMLSHDIRQPLGIVTSFCTLLLQDWYELTDAERREDLARILSASVGMSELVEEILTLTQLDADGLSARRTSVRVSNAVAEAVAGIATAEPGAITAAGDDCWVLVDPRHLHQILTNLISNALKYGAPPVEIGVTGVAPVVEISVRDHGDGVPAAFRPRLFSRFARADNPGTRAQKGTGLGLYIVRQLAEANDGAITYRDHPAGGGSFNVRLPAGQPPNGAPST